jgi:SAM-dependent methyltransferase
MAHSDDTAERALRERFQAGYEAGQTPTMLAVEACVFGCDYGATSWTTRKEARRVAGLLALAPRVRLLEIGAGSGWPALFLAKETGCDVTLVDLPLSGLRIAARRARSDGLSGACWVAAADGARLPFGGASFDAINQSDVLCCLIPKREVLADCHRVLRPGGRLVLSVISVAPGLAPADHARAVANGPDFVESEADYATLLGQTGWTIVEARDISRAFAASCRRQVLADEIQEGPLTEMLGAEAVAQRQADWHAKLACIEGGLLRRELYVATT